MSFDQAILELFRLAKEIQDFDNNSQGVQNDLALLAQDTQLSSR
jgi:hypothetical protein